MHEDDDINHYLPSLLNPRRIKHESNISFSQSSLASTALSLKRKALIKNNLTKISKYEKENVNDNTLNKNNNYNIVKKEVSIEESSLGLSAIEDLISIKSSQEYVPFSLDVPKSNKNACNNYINGINGYTKSKSLSTNNTIQSTKSESAVKHNDYNEKPILSLSFCVTNCDTINVNSQKSNLKKIEVKHEGNDCNVECELIEGSQLSEVNSEDNTNMDNILFSPLKRKAVTVNLEIKKQKLSTDNDITPKVLFLNTDAIEKLAHVIVQPPNYKLVKAKTIDNIKLFDTKDNSVVRNEINGKSDNLKQVSLDKYFQCTNRVKSSKVLSKQNKVRQDVCQVRKDNNVRQEMSNNSVQFNVTARTSDRAHRNDSKSPIKKLHSPKKDIRQMLSEDRTVSSARSRKSGAGSCSPKRNVDSIQFNVPLKSKSNRASVATGKIPHFKIVAGTHLAVDAFSYGEIPNVKHYFLTHFHSDHYAGLRKSFNKILFCSEITANLCISRLGVNPKCIQVITVDKTIRIEGIEVTAVDANHCPGALMLVFTLPNGKTLLHTGDFRATPAMESYPVFWNKDIHTIYLDTTYCNPRYDFPTQEHSLDMAIHLLRLKKMEVERSGRNFSSVLIVCGTYTIGKEKFFLGVARRIGCSVWACPEKERVLRAADAGSGVAGAAPRSCQLHVLPMRDLTHQTLRTYLDSLNGAFSEVVAFKPSGWENGKNSAVEKDSVTIHGIPYSEHSSFSELIRFVKFLKPKQVVPTVDISGGIKTVQKYFPCPLINKEEIQCQSRVTDYFNVQTKQPVT